MNTPNINASSALDTLPVRELVRIAKSQAFVPVQRTTDAKARYFTSRLFLLNELIGKTRNKERKVALQNLMTRSTSRNIDFGFGRRGGTPPRLKTITRLRIQAAHGMSGMAKRLPGGGHPTKKNTDGRAGIH